MSRYVRDDDAVEHGCCWDSAIVDTQTLTRYGRFPELVCECDSENVEMILRALNQEDERCVVSPEAS